MSTFDLASFREKFLEGNHANFRGQNVVIREIEPVGYTGGLPVMVKTVDGSNLFGRDTNYGWLSEAEAAQLLAPELLSVIENETRVAVEKALTAYKAEVKRVALEYAERHDLCEVVAEALGELGIKTKKMVDVTFSVPLDEDDEIGSYDLAQAIYGMTCDDLESALDNGDYTEV